MTLWRIWRFGARRRASEIVKTLQTLDEAFDLKLLRRFEKELERDLTTILRSDGLQAIRLELRHPVSREQIHLQISEYGELLDIAGRRLSPEMTIARRRSGRWDARLFVQLSANAGLKNDTPGLRLDWRPVWRDRDHSPRSVRRRRLRVVSAGQRRFAFGVSIDAGERLQNVFLHASEVPPGFQFVIGQTVSADIVTTSDGLQGRRIRPA